MGFAFAPVSCASWLFSTTRHRERTPEENFDRNYFENLKFWEEQNKKIREAFIKLGYTVHLNVQHTPTHHGDNHVIHDIFETEDYFAEANLENDCLTIKIHSNHWCFSDKEIPFMQSMTFPMSLFDKHDYFIKTYNIAVDNLNKSIEEYKEHANDTVHYKVNLFREVYGRRDVY